MNYTSGIASASLIQWFSDSGCLRKLLSCPCVAHHSMAIHSTDDDEMIMFWTFQEFSCSFRSFLLQAAVSLCLFLSGYPWSCSYEWHFLLCNVVSATRSPIRTFLSKNLHFQICSTANLIKLRRNSPRFLFDLFIFVFSEKNIEKSNGKTDDDDEGWLKTLISAESAVDFDGWRMLIYWRSTRSDIAHQWWKWSKISDRSNDGNYWEIDR